MPIYFADTHDSTEKADKSLYGGKGAGLLEMTAAGVSVPPALILTTETWKAYRKTGGIPQAVVDRIAQFIKGERPVSVRSGAPVSMPGMMDTLLNVGVTDTWEAKYPGSYRTFVESWLKIVKGTDSSRVKALIAACDERANGDEDKANRLLRAVVQRSDKAVDDSPLSVVLACVRAVFDSWDTPRAIAYRAMHNISDDMGTACVIQRMVMGNAEGFSGSGVMFSRDPATGENKLKGEMLFGGQGEAVVSGAVTPTDLSVLQAGTNYMRAAYESLCEIAEKLEKHYGEVQDIEFTFESGHLYVLQTRNAKMSAAARIRTAIALGNASKITVADIEAAKQARVVPGVDAQAMGLAASPGAVQGKIVTRHTHLDAIDKTCILVCEDTAPEDFERMARAGGILTATGGFTCHSAVVARGIGVPAVVGCADLSFEAGQIFIGGQEVKPGDTITIDGAEGAVFIGPVEVESLDFTTEVLEAIGFESHSRYLVGAVWNNRIAIPVLKGSYDSAMRAGELSKKLRAQGIKPVAFNVACSGPRLFGTESVNDLQNAAALNAMKEQDPDLHYVSDAFTVTLAQALSEAG